MRIELFPRWRLLQRIMLTDAMLAVGTLSGTLSEWTQCRPGDQSLHSKRFLPEVAA